MLFLKSNIFSYLQCFHVLGGNVKQMILTSCRKVYNFLITVGLYLKLLRILHVLDLYVIRSTFTNVKSLLEAQLLLADTSPQYLT